MEENWLNRTEMLIGKENLDKLKNSHVAIFGIGGVGSYALEGLVRSGIGTITIIDNDIVDITNINRQLIATTANIGVSKVEVAKKRALEINPNLKINIYQEYYSETNSDKLISNEYDYIIDAIDSVSSKLSLIETSINKNIPIISSMGTGNKLDPTKFEITDIYKTSVCPLAKVIRKELKKRNIKHLKVIYSKEEPKQNITDSNLNRTPASISFVPSVAGLIIASEVVKDLLK